MEKIYTISKEDGFTLLEFLIVLFFTGLLIALYVVGSLHDYTEIKEDETKHNLHLIQVALEQYHTDNGYYPGFLLGGEKWAGITGT